ncbi:MAG TPA: ATPase [Bacteroidales bacterium]|nr:ATPase [Bacteroidales bacterium]
MLRDVIKQLIVLNQDHIPFALKEREERLPLHSGKIITIPGVRRCGKSSRMKIAINELVNSGVSPKNILWMGFDDERLAEMNVQNLNEVLEAYRELYPNIPLEDVYMFFDEIQNIDGWELFVMRVFKNYCPNIFISGSNAKMLSQEIATTLRGWALEYKTYPLSFAEYCHFLDIPTERLDEQQTTRLRLAWDTYNRQGGFPEVVLTQDQTLRDKQLQSYYNAMLFRDLVERHKISNVGVLRYFVKRIMNNVTKPTSINSIYNDIRSQGLKISKDELYLWADYVCESFMFIRVPRYISSLIGEEQGLKKYYFIDNGMRQNILLPHSQDDGKLLESSVFLHLCRSCGELDKICYFTGDKECDFVVQHEDQVLQLIQVCWQMEDMETREREIAGLIEAHNATHCTNLCIVTHNQEDTIEYKGLSIRVIPAWKWMLASPLH